MLLYVACERLLCRGPSGLVVSASDLYSEGPGFESQNFSVDLISLSLSTSLTIKEQAY